MKILMKVLIVILVITLIPIHSFSVFAAGITDVLERKTQLLMKLGIYLQEDEMKYFDEYLTREKLAAILTVFYKINRSDSDNYIGVSLYTDVAENRWSSGHIFAAVESALMSGYSDGTFHPEEHVTYEQVAKGLVTLLGYREQAEHLGGYPSGYIATMAEKKLNNGISLRANDKVTQGQFTQMLFATMNTKMVIQKTYGITSEFSITTNETPLSHLLKIKKLSGILSVDANMALMGESELQDKKIKVGNKIFTITESYRELFGTNVTIYYKEDEELDDAIALFVEANPSKNNILKVEAEDVRQATTRKFCYYDAASDKEKNLSVPFDVSIIFNGHRIFLFEREHIMPKNGVLTFIDANNDGTYETIIVESYVDYYVNMASVKKNEIIITDKLGKTPLTLDLSSSDISFSVVKNGVTVSASEIKSGIVISVAADKMNPLTNVIDPSSKIFKISIGTDSFSGMINEYNADERELTVGEKKYRLSEFYNLNAYPIEMSIDGTIYLNANDQIVAIDKGYRPQYAFIIEVGEKSVISGIISMKIFTQEGEVKILNFASNIKIDGYRYSTAQDKITYLKGASTAFSDKTYFNMNNAAGYEQMISYSINSNGEVSSIDTVNPNNGYIDAEKNGFAHNLTLLGSEATPLNYFNPCKTIKSRIGLADDVIIFQVPSDVKNDNAFHITKITDYPDEAIKHNVSSFDADEFSFAKLLMVVADESQDIYLKEKNNMMLVEKTITILNGEGMTVTGIRGRLILTGAEITITPKSNDVLSRVSFVPGDIIRWKLDSYRDAIVIQKAMSLDGTGAVVSASNPLMGFYADVRFSYGSVVNVNDKYIKIRYNGNEIIEDVNILSGIAVVLTFDRQQGKILTGQISDIKSEKDFAATTASRIFTYQAYGLIKTIVIYK